MNIFKEIREKILQQVSLLQKEGKLPQVLEVEAVTAEPPREASHGDISTNAAMVLSKQANKNPRELATLIAEKIKEIPEVKDASVAGPGFINIRLIDKVWQKIIPHIIEEGSGFGNSEIGNDEIINIEYVSANPTGPMHIGHARNAVFGDILALLLIKAGYDVTKEYYINDAGTQIDVLAKSALLRYREALGEKIGEIPEGLYPGEYLKAVGEGLKEEYGKDLLTLFDEEKAFEIIKQFAIDSMMELIKYDLAELGIKHETFSSEQAIKKAGKIEEAFNFLDKKGLIYKGTLPPPKGQDNEDWEPAELTLFKSSEFGDDSDRPLKKRNGEWAYIMPDIAYHYDKFIRGFKKMILVIGADHAGYQKRLQAAVKAISDGKAELIMKLYQNVNFLEDGVQVKMSKRSGNFLTVRDVIDEVGKDTVRFMMMTRKHDTVLDFDFKKVKEQSKDNPVFYVQYAHARSYSVLRKAADTLNLDEIKNVDDKKLSLLKDNSELQLIKKIAEWPRVVESAASTFEPHRIAFYLYDLASEFHSLWNMGKENENLRFIIEGNHELTLARLALVKALAITIESGLNVLGVEPVREM